MKLPRMAGGLLLFMFPLAAAQAGPGILQADPWSVTLYAGPSTTKFFGAALQGLNFEPTGVMVGVAADKAFLDLGWGVALAGEGQVTQYIFGHPDTSFAIGLGFQARAPFGIDGTMLSFYSGPSYALDPPYRSIGYSRHNWPSARRKFLNYISLEYAVALSPSGKWDGVFRLYHRSGAFGVYSEGDDDGLAIGLGLRYAF